MKIPRELLIFITVIALAIVLHFIFDKPFKSEDKINNISNTENQKVDKLKIEILKEGTGVGAKAGNTVTVHYVGTLTSGVKFDSSVDRGTPFTLTLGTGSVIRGWEEGILGMKVGEKRRLTIPPDLAYGSAGAGGGVIPPNATLIFEIEMLEIK